MNAFSASLYPGGWDGGGVSSRTLESWSENVTSLSGMPADRFSSADTIYWEGDAGDYLVNVVGEPHVQLLHILALAFATILDVHDARVRDVGLRAGSGKGVAGSRTRYMLIGVLAQAHGLARRGPVDHNGASGRHGVNSGTSIAGRVFCCAYDAFGRHAQEKV